MDPITITAIVVAIGSLIANAIQAFFMQAPHCTVVCSDCCDADVQNVEKNEKIDTK